MTALCPTPEPPYYAVIFASLKGADDAGYAEANARMIDLAKGMDGFLGLDSARDGIGITVSYWRDLDAIARWRDHALHRAAQAEGRARWYDAYTIRIARVESQRTFERTSAP